LTIFVSIASYRDTELVPTIRDCLDKARHPEQLRFGLCWQHGDDEEILPVSRDPRMRVLDVDWRVSRGACWARSEILSLYRGEDYYLQIDSHNRFVQDWDSKLIGYICSASPKPIITTYCPPYSRQEPFPRPNEPTQVSFHSFTEDGIPLLRPTVIPNWKALGRLLRARFISAHFLFTLGAFVEEVPYDPNLYFHGEEITLTVRAYTWGYDLFHPPEVLLWHQYSRMGRPKHWDDHVPSLGAKLPWYERDRLSKERVRRLLLNPGVGHLDCGPLRTVAQYEAYAGISFQHRKVQDYTLRRLEPPNPAVAPDWHKSIRRWSGNIEIETSRLPKTALAKAQYWYVGICDSSGFELHRIDLSRDVLDKVRVSGYESITLQYEVHSEQAPASWMVWSFDEVGRQLGQTGGPVRAVPNVAPRATHPDQ
jgi:hypothetical protein